MEQARGTWLKTGAGLAGITLILLGLFLYVGIPAAPMLAGMLAGMVLALRNIPFSISPTVFLVAKGILGCVISSSLTLSVITALMDIWPVALLSIFSGLLAATFLGWFITHKGLLPGTTAIWGISPGGAATMTIMARDYGGSPGLVAFMQYSRVVIITAMASVISAFIVPQHAEMASRAAQTITRIEALFLPVDALNFLASLLFAVVMAYVGKLSRLPSASLLLPALLGAALNISGMFTLVFPGWFLTLCYICIGWIIGLNFSRELLLQAWHALPAILLAIFALIGLCGLVAVFLVLFADIEPLTAFLATCPGGADTMAVIASSTHADTGFVMSIQVCRLLTVIAFAPIIATRFSIAFEKRKQALHG